MNWKVVPITPDNRSGVPEFMYRMFGYTYTDTSIYDPTRILDNYSGFVCVSPSGSVHGLLLLSFGFPGRRIIEIGELLLDADLSESASGNILKQFLDALRQELFMLADQQGLRTAFSLEVTEHQLTQRLSQKMGFIIAGVYLGYVPGWQRRLRTRPGQRTPGASTEHNRNLRRTMTVSVRPFRTKTPLQTVTVPDRFEALVREIYKDFRLAVEYVPATPPPATGKLRSRVDFMRGIASIVVEETGSDTPDAVVDLLRHYRNGFIDLIHVVLPLAGDINSVVERLVEAGCGFGALLPQYGEDPHLVMQSISPELLPEVSQGVLSPRAARILAGLS
jgi:hypothetical protein